MLCAIARHGVGRSEGSILLRSRLLSNSVAISFAQRRNIAASLSLTRSLSSQPTPNTTPTDSSLPPKPPTSGRKTKTVHLKPAPIKPSAPQIPVAKTTSAKAEAPADLADPQQVGFKEVTLRDVQDAEQHGILKPPPEGASWAKRTMHTMIQLIKFYFRGIKLIFSNGKNFRALKRRVAAGGEPLTRKESRFMATHRTDVIKLVPFLIIVILLEEVIPLIALYAPFMLPSTCILPSQKARMAEKRTSKAIALASETPVFRRLADRITDGILDKAALKSRDESIVMCGVLGVSSFGPPPVRIGLIARRMRAIIKDDALLAKESFGANLTTEELHDALEERGLLASNSPIKAQRTILIEWIKQTLADAETEADEAVYRRLAIIARAYANGPAQIRI